MMEYQGLFNVVLGVASVLGGWVLRVLWESMRDLQLADRQLAEKVGTIEVLVAGRYITRDEFQRNVDALFAKLDRIDGKLHEKADK